MAAPLTPPLIGCSASNVGASSMSLSMLVLFGSSRFTQQNLPSRALFSQASPSHSLTSTVCHFLPRRLPPPAPPNSTLAFSQTFVVIVRPPILRSHPSLQEPRSISKLSSLRSPNPCPPFAWSSVCAIPTSPPIPYALEHVIGDAKFLCGTLAQIICAPNRQKQAVLTLGWSRRALPPPRPAFLHTKKRWRRWPPWLRLRHLQP